MSLWTMQVMEILKNYALPQTNLPFDSLIDATYQDYFNFDFPWYTDNDNGTSKIEFQKLFLLRHMMDYIGQETIEQHRMFLAERLREVMPMYTQLFESMNLDMDWIKDVDMTYTGNESGTRNTTGNSSRETEVTNNNTTNTQAINSDNPQITIQTEDYASEMSRGQSTSQGTGSETSSDTSAVNENTSRDESRSESGYRGRRKGDVIKEYRESILNLNQMLLEECKDLFLGVW